MYALKCFSFLKIENFSFFFLPNFPFSLKKYFTRKEESVIMLCRYGVL